MSNSFGRYNEILDTPTFQKDFNAFYQQHPNMEDWRAAVEFVLARDPKSGRSHELTKGFRVLVVDSTEGIPEISVLYRFNEKDEQQQKVHLFGMESI